jgi:PHD/YefM family antitoxin component YafN of YafNO toxin-antitoxin module
LKNLRISYKVRIIREVSISDMVKVASAEFQKHIGRYQDMALVQPVTITRNGRDRTVMISADEYYRLKRRDREVLGLDDFTEADLAAIRTAEPPTETALFDHELK